MLANHIDNRAGGIHDPIVVSDGDIESKDVLKRRSLAERILRRLDEPGCPAVIGIYGGWGTGKSSILNLLWYYNEKLSKKNSFIINIDAWKYESEGSLFIPVIVKLRQAAGDTELPHGWKSLVKKILATTGLTLADIALAKVGVDRQQISKNLAEIENRDDDASYIYHLKKWETQTNEIDETETAFRELVSVASQTQHGRNILICVDNLDRCSPENAVRLLESVKVFFSVPGCTWLFAMDSDVIAGFINKKYQDAGVDGYSYLDKIIPEQYHLSLSPASDEKVIAALLRRSTGDGLQIDISKIPQIPKILVPRRLIKSARKFTDFYKGRFTTKGVPPETVMALCLLYHTWPDFYQRLSSESEDHIRRILDNFFQEDIQTNKPSKKNIPLRDSFLKDSELTYFICMAFEGIKSDSSAKYLRDIVNGFSGLRECGLP